MTAKELEKKLKKDGWVFKHQVGSHRHYVHPTKKGKVTVPYHAGDIKLGTLRNILKVAGLSLKS